MDNEQDPNYIFALGDQIKTDTQAIDYIRDLINKSAPSWGPEPDLAEPDEIKALVRLVGDICVILCYVRKDKDSYMDDDEAVGLVRSLLRDPIS